MEDGGSIFLSLITHSPSSVRDQHTPAVESNGKTKSSNKTIKSVLPPNMLHTPRPYLGQAETPVPPVGRASLPDQNVFIMFGGSAINLKYCAAINISGYIETL